MDTIGPAKVALPYPDLVQLISELDARAHDLARFADEARRHRDARQASAYLEHRNEVLRLREYLHGCALAAAASAAPARRGNA
jgi:hypothetical protein